jgi:AraC-like DNA-binding protein
MPAASRETPSEQAGEGKTRKSEAQRRKAHSASRKRGRRVLSRKKMLSWCKESGFQQIYAERESKQAFTRRARIPMFVECSTMDCLKIMEARKLIESTDIPIPEISNRLGFSSLDEFMRKFLWFERVKPEALRRGNRNGNIVKKRQKTH